MDNHYKMLTACQLVARTALDMASKFNSADYAKLVLEGYNDSKRPATRNDIQQQVCDVKTAVDDMVRTLEGLGFENVTERYDEVED